MTPGLTTATDNCRVESSHHFATAASAGRQADDAYASTADKYSNAIGHHGLAEMLIVA
jgi:hypothetical protein